jgi:hypothetical protein
MALMMLRHLREHGTEEPPLPMEGESRYMAEEMSSLHYEWARSHQAIRLLLGIQLVNLAEDQLGQKGDDPG